MLTWFSYARELALRELKHWYRIPGQIVFSVLLTPLIWLALLGLSFQSAERVPGIGVRYVDFITPTVVAMMVLLTSAPGSMCIVLDRNLGFFNRLLALPIPRFIIALGYVMELMVKSLLQVGAVLSIAALLGVQFATGLGGALLILLFSVLLGFGFACLGLTMALRIDDPGAFAGMANFIVMPLLFLTPAFFPLAQLPSWLELLTRFNPVAYFINPVRDLIVRGFDWNLIGVGLLILLVFDALMALNMSRTFRRATTD